MVLCRHIGWKRTFCITLCLSVTCPGYHTPTRGCVPASQQLLLSPSSLTSVASLRNTDGAVAAPLTLPAPTPSPCCHQLHCGCSPHQFTTALLFFPSKGETPKETSAGDVLQSIFQQKHSLTCMAGVFTARDLVGRHQPWGGGQKRMRSNLNSLSHWAFSSMVSSPSFSLLSHKVAIQTDF